MRKATVRVLVAERVQIELPAVDLDAKICSDQPAGNGWGSSTDWSCRRYTARSTRWKAERVESARPEDFAGAGVVRQGGRDGQRTADRVADPSARSVSLNIRRGDCQPLHDSGFAPGAGRIAR